LTGNGRSVKVEIEYFIMRKCSPIYSLRISIDG
jgi:hypothetical protein